MQNAFDFLNQDTYLNYPLIYALRHGAEVIAANELAWQFIGIVLISCCWQDQIRLN